MIIERVPDHEFSKGKCTTMSASSPLSDEARFAFEEQLLVSLQCLHDGFMSIDLSWCCTYVNKSAERLLGKQREELLGQNLWELFPDLIGGLFWQACHEVVQVQRSRQIETFSPFSPQRLIVYLSTSPNGIVCVFHDQDVQEKQNDLPYRPPQVSVMERYRAIMQTSSEGVCFVDREACTLSVNERMAVMLGYTVEEVVGRPFSAFVFPEDMHRAQEHIGRSLQGMSEQFALRFRRKDDSVLDVLASSCPMHDETKDIAGVLGMFTDLSERKQAEVDRLRLAAIVEYSDDAIISKTLDGIITSWNQAAQRMFGYSSQETVGRSITIIIPDELREEERMILSKLRNGERIDHFETVRMRKDGSRLDISLTISPIKNSLGQIIGASKIARDITESKRLHRNVQFLASAGKVLAASLDYRATLRTVAGMAVPHMADWCAITMLAEDGSVEPLAVAHVDPQQAQQATRLRELYPLNMDAAHGTPLVLRSGCAEFIPHVDDAVLMAVASDDEHFKSLRAAGISSSMTVPLLMNGKARGTLTFVAAQSARRYTEADLAMAEELASRVVLAIQNAQLYRSVQQSRDQLDIILQGVADGIIVYAQGSDILYANQAAATLSGFVSVPQMLAASQSNLLGRYELIDERSQPFALSQLTHLRVFEGEPEATAIMGYRERETTTAPNWSLVTSRPVADENGNVLMVITIIHDITERMNVERRKDEFISMASHELKTPVTSLKGFARVLQQRLSKQADTQGLHYLARMDAQLNKLVDLINELLDISRIQSGKLPMRTGSVDLDSLIEEIVEMVQVTTATHHLYVEGSTGARILADRDRLGQVFINLLTNAIKYSAENEPVVVRLSPYEEGRQALVSVQDSGIGIDPVHHEKIFERFYRVSEPVESSYPGLGIGLYICGEIVARHGGRIWVESGKGQGATFFVALPQLVEDETAQMER
jgi:PAS domain S-box-containing protein